MLRYKGEGGEGCVGMPSILSHAQGLAVSSLTTLKHCEARPSPIQYET